MMTTATGFEPCGWCGLIHQGACPKVKAIEYYPNGTIKRIEFHGASMPAQPIGGGVTTTSVNASNRPIFSVSCSGTGALGDG
jgi:hypothetical protein